MRVLFPILLSLNILFTDGLLPASMTASLFSVSVSAKETSSVHTTRSTLVPVDFPGCFIPRTRIEQQQPGRRQTS